MTCAKSAPVGSILEFSNGQRAVVVWSAGLLAVLCHLGDAGFWPVEFFGEDPDEGWSVLTEDEEAVASFAKALAVVEGR